MESPKEHYFIIVEHHRQVDKPRRCLTRFPTHIRASAHLGPTDQTSVHATIFFNQDNYL
jgi:hypothetical protein